MMKTKRSYWILALLNLLLLGSVQRGVAEDGQPRMYIPNAEVDDASIIGYSIITPKNPYFTFYLWYLNTDHKNAYWTESPVLTVDGHSLTLSGIHGDNPFDKNNPSAFNTLTCKDGNGNILYWVHWREYFKVGDRSFTESFALKQFNGNPNEDWYVVMEIMFPENVDGGDPHTVSVRGKAHLDSHDDGYYDALGPNNEKVLKNGGTQAPFGVFENVGTSLDWTNPGELTFTSQSFENKTNWGQYFVTMDGQTSEHKRSGAITVTKDYGEQANYADNSEKPVRYTYCDAYDWDDPSQSRDNPNSFSYTFNFSNSQYIFLDDRNDHGFNNSAYVSTPIYNRVDFYTTTHLELSIENVTNGYQVIRTASGTNFKFKCHDAKNFTYVRVNGMTSSNELKSFDWSGLSKSGSISLPANFTIQSFDFTFDRTAYGNNLEFTQDSKKSPKSLPYPDNLTADYNPWNKSVTLNWNFENVNSLTRNYEGTFKLLRDGSDLTSMSTSFGSAYHYTDETLDYDKDYKYAVAFIPTGWTDTKPVSGLMTEKVFNLQHTVDLGQLNVTTISDGYQLDWTLNSQLNGTEYEFNVYRTVVAADNHNPSVTDFDMNNPLTTLKVNDITQKNYSYTDHAVNSTSTYAYLVTLAAQKTNFYSGPTVPVGHPNGSKLKSITATRGTYTDKVTVQWESVIQGEDHVDYTLYRHLINEGENRINTFDEAKKLDWDIVATFKDTNETVLSYDDVDAVPGHYYAYAIVASAHDANDVVFSRMVVDGFARSTGIAYGSITYEDSKFAVEGAKVVVQAGDSVGRSQFNSLSFDGSSRLNWTVDGTKMNTYFRDRAFSVQMYVNPADGQSGKCLLDMDNTLRLSLGNYDEAQGYPITVNDAIISHLHIKPGRFTSLTFAYDGNGQGMLYVMAPDSLGNMAKEQLQNVSLSWPKNNESQISLFGKTDKSDCLKGYADEVRFFKRQLTEADVLQNYNHYLGGTESGLVAYWSFDEGISTLRHAYDYSKTGTASNDNYADIEGGVRTHNELPTPEQLSLFAVTDTLGQYTVQGIPFVGEGTTYSIIPSKGEHSFSPTTRTIYVSPSTLSFDPQNFTDNSSFNVKGVVYYENTTYPVKGCRFRVDDVVVKDEWGNEILSDENGEFTIPVSIGQHAIYVEKEGHTFLNNGRYPKIGLLNVNDSISHLTFTDQTKAVVVGRVVGGSQEKNKPLGWGLSTATVGAATLTLLTSNTIEDSRSMNVKLDSLSGVYYDNPDTIYYQPAHQGYVNSVAYTSGSNASHDDVKRIIIKTDPASGEFAVELPPVPYYISTKVDHNGTATAGLNSNILFDASDVLRQDTVEVDGVQFHYNSSFVQAYTATPTITVKQTDNDYGAFGEAKSSAKKADGTQESVDVYTVKDGQVTYHYDYPIFDFAAEYSLEISSFESYFNYDGEQPMEFRQPTQGLVSFSNMMTEQADTTTVLPLDSIGHCLYTFQALNPNIDDASSYTRPLDITVHIGDYPYYWYWDKEKELPLTGIVFGAVLTGNAFVTKAPNQVINILRDPFGSTSSLTWEKGTTRSYSYKMSTNFKLGGTGETEQGEGADAKQAEGVPGAYFVSGASNKFFITNGFEGSISLSRNQGLTWNLTTTKSYSTSDKPLFDGPNGDVFIGVSSSLVYGDGKNVQFISDGNGGWTVGTDDAIVTGQTVDNDFAYSQYYIENSLIPNYLKLRNDLLQVVTPQELENFIQSPNNTTDKPIYMTTRKPTDPDFGASNDTEQVKKTKDYDSGDSYTVFWPKSGYGEDEVLDYNEQVKNWKACLADNEDAKVKAIYGSSKPEYTYTFDNGPGSTMTENETFNFTEEVALGKQGKTYRKLLYNTEVTSGGYLSFGGSVQLDFEHSRQPSFTYGKDQTKTYSITFSDDVNDNSHEVSVYEASDDYSRIFFQRGGQTSRNYEGEQRTKYYEPGTIISNATDQIEIPHISCDKTVVTGVPAGEAAVFQLKLSNQTTAQITQKIDYELYIENDKWGAMANVTANSPLSGNSYPIVLYPGQVAEVNLYVKQASPDIIHIDSLHVSFYSAGQMAISDDIILAAHFQPKAEAVTLAASRDLVNTATDSTLVLTASGYDLNSSILNGVMLQQRRADSPEWTTIHSWVKGTPAGDTESKLEIERIDTLIDMHSGIFYPDATYQFRAVTDCTVGTEQVLGLSDTITVVKDVTLPQPLYLPEPADGVLGAGDNISLTFNEDIRSQSLNKVDNFIIQSILNTDSVAHEVALRLDGGNAPVATSQSQLTLGSTSVTLCSWVKSGGTAGTLFRHGEGKNAFRVDIDGDGYVTAYVTDEHGEAKPYKSDKALPKDIWSYVAVVYDVDNGDLSAYYASGDKEDILMEAVPAGKDGHSTGYIYLGEGLTGAMHELSLFCVPLTWTTIKAQMYLGKSHSTPSLIGYWRLDEGHGDKSEDLARSRHMRLASANGWYMENENLTMALDGTHYAGIPMGQLSTTEGVSYLVEMWMLADEQQGDNTQLLSMDNGQKLDLNIADNGTLVLVADSTAYSSSLNAYRSPMNDHQWHHVALNVLKGSNGQASVLVDGTVVLTVAADKVPTLAGGRLWLGRGMKGMLDEVRLWHGMNTQETIAERMYYRLDGSNIKELVGYYPMEKTYYDEYDQRVFEFSTENKGYEATAATALVTDAEGVTLSEGSDAPGLKTAPNKTNLDFGFVADERTVSVTLDHSAESLEGCTVDVTLRDYYDMHSNVGTPITWSFVVKQNALSWNTSEVDIREKAGEDVTFTATLTNNGQGDEQWSFTELPSWLEASPSSGTIFAHGSEEITFTVKPGNGIGKYFTTVNACGSKDLDTPLDICLTVEGQRPDWAAENTGRSMTVTGQIKIDGVLSTDPEDIVAAFDDSESLPGKCIGVGQPRYKSSKDAYYVDMSIYGTEKLEGQPVHFRIYDASTGKIHYLTNVSQEVQFATNTIVGTSTDPVIWENSEKLLELADLKEGFQWISFYLKPDDSSLSVFNPVKSEISTVQVGPGENDTYTYKRGKWSDDFNGIDAGMMMMVEMDGDATLPVVGEAVDPAKYEITVNPGSNWIGVPTDNYMTLDEAFAGLSPEEGDQVKSQTAFSTFENGAWDGLLEVIEPGKGYIYTSQATTNKTFTFPSIAANRSMTSWRNLTGIAANFKYRHNMVVVCTIHDKSGNAVQAKSVEVYDAAGELRAKASRCFRDSLYILIVSGEEAGEPVVIRVQAGGWLNIDEGWSALLHFQPNKLIGTFKSPLVLEPETVTGIEAVRFGAGSHVTVYGLTGQTVFSGSAEELDLGRLAKDGVYIVEETTASGQRFIRKMKH